MTKITEQTLQDAFELQLQALSRAAPTYYNASKIDEVRENWPLEKLMQKCGEAWFNGRVLSLRSVSGFGAVGHPDAHAVDLPPSADNESLGCAVNEVLDESWDLTLRDLTAEVRSIEREEIKTIYDEWLNAFMRRHGYKSKKALFNNMLHCRIVCQSGRLTFFPSNHNRLDGWSGEGLPVNAAIVIPAIGSQESIGSALRSCFDRCLDTYGRK